MTGPVNVLKNEQLDVLRTDDGRNAKVASFEVKCNGIQSADTLLKIVVGDEPPRTLIVPVTIGD
jgi:hypothetical protein